jgi:TonB family protein
MPLAARLNVSVIAEINEAIFGARRSDPDRDMEIGGILLGAVDGGDGARPTVRIERFDQMVSEHRRGSSYALTDRDKKALAKKIDWWIRHGASKGLRPVGFFRSHTRRGLYLDQDDFTLFQHYFPEPAAVFLLVRPMTGAGSVGGFFFWEEGDMHRESSYQEFPFDDTGLPLTVVEPVAAPAPPPPPPRPAAAMPKPAMWLQVAVPLAVGVVLGAVVFELTTHSAPVRSMVRPSPAKSTPPAPVKAAVEAVAVEKPSPLATKRPIAPAVPLPAPKAPATADRAMRANPIASLTGSASRTDATIASAAVPAAAPEAAPVAEATPPPAAAPLAPITAPAPVQRARPTSVATVTVEPVPGSKLGRFVGHIPGFRHRRQGFVPARPIHQVAPAVPPDERLARDVPVDLRVTVDPAGNVAEVEQASRGGDRELVRVALDAARGWQFVPARKDDETVTSQLILHFRFPGATTAE